MKKEVKGWATGGLWRRAFECALNVWRSVAFSVSLLFQVVLVSLCAGEEAPVADTAPKLWYRQPAAQTNWEEALPVGNGRLGAMVFGGVQEERLQLNEGNIWSGSPKTYDRVGAYKAFPAIRQLIYDGSHKEARERVKEEVLGERPLGCYQPLGDLTLRFEGDEKPTEYRRELNLDEAVARVSYRVGSALFTREIFSSVPDQAVVVRLTCDQPGRLTFTAQLRREADAESASKGASGLVLKGQADRGRPTAGTHFVGRLEARPEGGTVTSRGGVLRVERANAVTLFLCATSDYRSAEFEALCEKQLSAAAARSYAALREANVNEHQRLFRRVTLNLGKAPRLPTDERLGLFRQGAPDPALIALYFQYGRYLLISSSRSGNLPATLQGLWSQRMEAPWFCGWHFDVNAQMNYWMAETANLSECHEPFFDLIDALRINGRKTAKDVYGGSGFVFSHRTTAWLFTAPVNGLTIWPTGAGWSCQHLWEHYQFTQDRAFLRSKGYPIMKEAAEFYLTWLSPDPATGKLVSGPSISPENSFLTGESGFADLDMGPAMDQQIIAELFDNCLSAGDVLGISDAFIGKVKKARENLAPGIKIGGDGRILEWSTERPEREPGHRHLSHLYALYPGAQISPRKTPGLAGAARKSLDVRLQHGGVRGGGKAADSGNTGWSLAWNASLWARLGDGERAQQTIRKLIADITFPNLMDKCPWGNQGFVFQIDGNLGLPAAMIEMLLQSHAGEIELLPALPEAWSAGSATGLRARGAFEIDLDWADGQMRRAAVRSLCGGACNVRLGAHVAKFSTQPGEVLILDNRLNRSVE